MKKYLFIFFAIYSCNAFAYYNETIPNKCGVIGNKMYAIFTPNVHTCSAGYFLPANVDGCRPCPDGYTCSGGTFSFNETINQGNIPNQHTCSAGYFLPANTDGCRPCPNDYTCAGGTFTFNERQSQGIKYKQITRENIPYACATNMPHNMVAIFNPNTININWSDADSVDIAANNAGSVVYDSDIRTPVKAHHKPGKLFTGWKFSAPIQQ